MALLSLLFLITSVNLLQNIGGGTTDLSENSTAQAPTNTTYWIDETTQTALGVDFDNYTLTQDTSASTTTYLIQSETDLAFLSWTIYTGNAYNNHVSGSYYYYSDICFKQTKNLDLSAYYWQPIGIGYTRDGTSAARYFSGNYDGDGHTVSGVFTPAGSSNGYSYQGLFGRVGSRSSTLQASIANLGVIDSFVQGYYYVGGVVGSASGTISNCYNTGSVEGTNYVGGVVGFVSAYATISNAYNTGSVSGYSYVGGVVGNAGNSTVSNVYNTGSVSGSSYVGGVVGIANGTISNAYYGGACTLPVGIGSGSGSATKIDSPVEDWAKNEEWYSAYATGEDGTLVWDSAYPWDFENVWNISVIFNGGYPCFDAFWTDKLAQNQLGVDFDRYTLRRDTSASTTTYLIQSEKDLAFLSWTIYTGNAYNNHVSGSYYYSGITFKQTKDLNLSDYYWQPIGISYTREGTYVNRYFSGNYDGGGYTVSGVFTPAGSSNGYYEQGLFGRVYGRSSTQQATITNVGVIDSFVQGYSNVGGVVGYASNSTITNCYNTGSVEGTGGNVGGVAGNIGGDVTNCYNTGTVSGVGDRVGGVVGNAYGGDVTNCYNTGTVSGSGEYVGGVVGYASSDVANCYNTGSVERTGKRVGGVVGYAFSSTIIINCYNTGSVSGNNQVGGVVGLAISHSTITNCYNTGSVSGNNQVGGVMGYAQTSSTITNCYNTGSVEGTGGDVGGVAGIVSSRATVTNTYYGGACTLPVGIGSGSGSATKIDAPVEEWAKNEEWYSAYATDEDGTLIWDSEYSWDFKNVWNISVVFNGGYPCFDAFWTDKLAQNQLGVDFDNYSFDIDEKNRSIYYINNEADLAYLSWVIENEASDKVHVIEGMISCYFSGITFVQTADLDLSDYYWLPIAQRFDGQTGGVMFAGNYDGNGYSISGLYTPAFPDDYQGDPYDSGYAYRGLFGTVVNLSLMVGSGSGNCILENITILDSVIKGYGYHGGLVARSMGVDISNCHVEADVYGASTNGGIVGELSSATLSNCTHVGLIHTTGTGSGGLVGNLSGSIIHCTHIGDIISELSYNGGIAGEASSGATIDSCFVQGNFSGSSYAFVGRVSGSVVVSNSGFEGSLEVQGAFSGSNGTFQNCYIIAEGASNFTAGQGNYTITNCLGIFTVDGTTTKRRRGTDFSAFAWPNADSCPVPKSLSWIGQFWSGDITAEIMSSSEWTS